MRLTLNLRDDVLHPTGHPLVLVFSFFFSLCVCVCVTQEQCRRAEMIAFRVDMMTADVCCNIWSTMPWEINSISVNINNWDGLCDLCMKMMGLSTCAFSTIWILSTWIYMSSIVDNHAFDWYGFYVRGILGRNLLNSWIGLSGYRKWMDGWTNSRIIYAVLWQRLYM